MVYASYHPHRVHVVANPNSRVHVSNSLNYVWRMLRPGLRRVLSTKAWRKFAAQDSMPPTLVWMSPSTSTAKAGRIANVDSVLDRNWLFELKVISLSNVVSVTSNHYHRSDEWS